MNRLWSGPYIRASLTACTTLFLLLFTTGCWDRLEVEERTSVVAIAMDKDKDNPGHVVISVQIPIPIAIAGSSGGASGIKDAVKVISASGSTAMSAFQNLQKRLNHELFYGHTRIIAIGEDLAREGITNILDSFRRDPQIRRLLWPIVVKGEARSALETATNLEQIPTVFLMTLIESGARTGRIPNINLGDFYSDLSSDCRQPYLNYLEIKNNDVKWDGVALFHEDQMIAKLSVNETWQVMRIREKEDGGFIIFPYENNPDEKVVMNTEMINVKQKVSYENDHVVVRITVNMEGNVWEKTFQDNLFEKEAIDKIQASANRYMDEEAKKLLDKLQHEYNNDALGIGGRIKAFQPNIWKKLDWEKDFPNADIQITYNIKVRNLGMEMR